MRSMIDRSPKKSIGMLSPGKKNQKYSRFTLTTENTNLISMCTKHFQSVPITRTKKIRTFFSKPVQAYNRR